MHPDVLREEAPCRGPLRKGFDPDMKRAEAFRRLLAHDDHYPHCPQCGRAMLAESAVRFQCPDQHTTVTLPVPSRPAGLRRLFGIFTVRTRERCGA